MHKKKWIIPIFALLLAGCTPAEKPTRQEGNTSSIQQKNPSISLRTQVGQVPIKNGTGKDAKTIGYLSQRDNITAQNKIGNKYQIKTKDGKTGYVQQGEVQPEDRANTAQNQLPPTPQTAPGATPQTAPENQTSQQDATAKAEVSSSLNGDEQTMLSLLNQERRKAGLKEVIIDPEVQKLAKLKSQDMIDKNYFSHQSPTYGSPFDMLKSHGVSYLHAGENIAGNNNVNQAHTSLMNSEGHRKNILNPSFTHIGIGMKEGGQYGKMYTQIFIGR